jgi:hypothetical protein
VAEPVRPAAPLVELLLGNIRQPLNADTEKPVHTASPKIKYARNNIVPIPD